MTDIEALIAEWREAAKDVTPGEWAYTLCDDGIPMVHTDGDIICWPDPNHGSDGNRPDAMDTTNLAWIARCSPFGISALLDTIEALKAERDAANDRMAAAVADYNDAREQLERAQEALEQATDYIDRVSGAALGIAMSGDNHPNPDAVLMDFSREGMALSQTVRAARRIAQEGK